MSNAIANLSDPIDHSLRREGERIGTFLPHKLIEYRPPTDQLATHSFTPPESTTDDDAEDQLRDQIAIRIATGHSCSVLCSGRTDELATVSLGQSSY